MSDPAADAVARAFRDERAAVLATLIRHVGDFQLAEDAVQDAYAAALTTWPRDGVPANPGAWLTVTARRRAIDRLRRDRSVADRSERLAEERAGCKDIASLRKKEVDGCTGRIHRFICGSRDVI